MVLYNLTNITNANTYPDILIGVNNLSNGLFGSLLLLSIFVISFLSLKNYTSKNALAGSMFLTTILGVILALIGIVPEMYMTYLILGCGIVGLIMIFQKDY